MEDVLTYVPHRGVTVASPGPVAALGTTATQIRLKQSTPDSPLRFMAGTIKKGAARLGTMVSDGQVANPKTHGFAARTTILPRSRLRKSGTAYHALVPEDRDAVPNVASNLMSSYTLLENEANSNFGSLFQDEPDGYKPPPGAMLRGGNYPSVYNSDEPPENSQLLRISLLDGNSASSNEGQNQNQFKTFVTDKMIPFKMTKT